MSGLRIYPIILQVRQAFGDSSGSEFGMTVYVRVIQSPGYVYIWPNVHQ